MRKKKKKHSSSSCFPSSLSFSSICSGKVANPSIIAPPFLNTWARGNLRATYLFRLPKITYIQHHSSFPGPIFSCGAHSYTVGVLNLGHSVRLLADASNLWWIVQTHIFAGRPTISLGRVCAPCTEAAFSPQQPRPPIRPVALCRTSSSTFSSCSLSVFGCTVKIMTWWGGGRYAHSVSFWEWVTMIGVTTWCLVQR